jgi:hypothetical protein
MQSPRNLLDNGEMKVQQRGTGTATCGTTAGLAITSYAADRWGCDVNVTSGAGQLTPITSSPTPPVGFSQALKLVRNSGALTQPQCAWQEIKTADVIAAQGQLVTLSYYAQALAGLAADNGNVIQSVIITGTGTDQGMGVLRSAVGMTASPAITPVWTGLATLQTQSQTLSASAFNRFVAPAVAVPTTVTEMAVGLCFTPTATGAGTTDGFAFTGAQLEVGGAASPYEWRPLGMEVVKAQRYFWQLTESNTVLPYTCTVTGTNATSCPLVNPVKMDVAATATLTVGGLQLIIDAAAGTGATGGAAGTGSVDACVVTFTNTITAAVHSVQLRGSGTTGLVTCSADF